MKTKNERGAGRKKTYTVDIKKISVPVPILDEVQKMSKPYLTVSSKKQV